MTLEFISLNKNCVENEYAPNYITKIDYNGRFVNCNIFTNAFLVLHKGLIFARNKINYKQMNGNLFFELEVRDRKYFGLERELNRKVKFIIRNQTNLKNLNTKV